MASLYIFAATMVLSVLIAGWAVALSARAVKSPRGRFSVGVIVVVLFTLASGVVAGIGSAVTTASAAAALAVGLTLLVLQLATIFFVLRSVFRLSVAQTFAPFGVYVVVLLGELGLALFLIKPYVAEAFVMPTQSMSPTIEPRDRFMVNKLISPKRLDLIAYWGHMAPQPAIYCKRLIAFPGETLRFEQGGIFVNNQPVALPPVIAGRCHASPASWPASQARYRDGESIVLGPDEYFVIGDNVDASADSRTTGPTSGSSLVGVVDVMYWPLGRARIMR